MTPQSFHSYDVYTSVWRVNCVVITQANCWGDLICGDICDILAWRASFWWSFCPHVVGVWFPGPLFTKTVNDLPPDIMKSVSKPRDWVSTWSYRFEIWQALQHCWWDKSHGQIGSSIWRVCDISQKKIDMSRSLQQLFRKGFMFCCLHLTMTSSL